MSRAESRLSPRPTGLFRQCQTPNPENDLSGLGAVESGPRAGDIGSPQRLFHRAAPVSRGIESVSRSSMTGGRGECKRLAESELYSSAKLRIRYCFACGKTAPDPQFRYARWCGAQTRYAPGPGGPGATIISFPCRQRFPGWRTLPPRWRPPGPRDRWSVLRRPRACASCDRPCRCRPESVDPR